MTFRQTNHIVISVSGISIDVSSAELTYPELADDVCRRFEWLCMKALELDELQTIRAQDDDEPDQSQHPDTPATHNPPGKPPMIEMYG